MHRYLFQSGHGHHRARGAHWFDPHGQEVQITLNLEEDYTLKEWDSDCDSFSSSETTIDFIATKDCEIQAILEKKQYTL